MKELTKITPEPPVDEIFTKEYLKRLSDKGHILNMTSTTDIIRLLIHKVNELTDEVNRMKGVDKTDKKSDLNVNNVEEVADKLWKESNPISSMETPNMVYIHVENHEKEWLQTDRELSLYDWIKKYKWNK